MKTIAQQLNVKDFPFIIRDNDENIIYWEDSVGYWAKRKFDSKGNEIYYEDSTGFWAKKEYNSKGKEIYYEDSNGCWSKSEYNSKGKEIYFENSDGVVIDNRPNPSCEAKIVKIEGKKYKLTEVK